MATNQIVVGSKDCRILKVTSLLKSSQSFHLFHDTWTLIANDLETKRDLVKTFHRDYLIKTIGLIDIINGLLEEWVARTGENATLTKLARILEDNGLKDCADLMVKGIIEILKHEKSENVKKRRTHKYSTLPTGLSEFLRSSSNLCILHTLDMDITCEKLSEKVGNPCLHDYSQFLEVLESPEERDDSIIDIVRNYTIKRFSQLKNLCEKTVNKVILVTCEEEGVITGALKNIPPSENKLELIHDKMAWTDLTLSFQLKITKRLEDKYQMEFNDLELDGQLLVDLINEKNVKLFRETLPEELSYYVERSLSTRSYISMKIFDQNSPDIFLFTGIDRYELSSLAKSKLTDTSSNQLRQAGFTVNFMVLDEQHHLEKIVEKCSNPVHLIRHGNGELKCIKSYRSMKMLQDYVDNSQDELDEEEFEQNVNSTIRAVIISDSPGMGKTVLLGNLGRRLQRKHPERNVLFLILSEFIKQLKEDEQTQITTSITTILGRMTCENVLGKIVLSHQLNLEELSIELLLDGFDELNSAHVPLAYEVLQVISSIKAVRLWVTSRPHFLEELEIKLNVFGLNISPFEEEHQVKFLSSYWSRNGLANSSNLESFATKCLKLLKSQMDSKNDDIAGIPLQCLLLGQIYEEEAIAHANSEQPSVQPSLNLITNITDLYKLMIQKKVEKYLSVHVKRDFCETQTLMEMHVRFSLELIFPEYVGKLEDLLSTVNMEELLKVGVLESSSTEISPRFLHRTFAEYFLAWFAVDKLGEESGWNETMTNFLFDRILQSLVDSEEFRYFDDDDVEDYMSDDSEGASDTSSDPEDKDSDIDSDPEDTIDKDEACDKNSDLQDAADKEDGSDTDSNMDGASDIVEEKTIFGFANPVIAYFMNALVVGLQSVPDQISHSIIKKCSNSATTGMQIVYTCARHNFANILESINGTNAFAQYSKIIFSKKGVLLSIDYSELLILKLAMEHFEQHHKWGMDHDIQAELLHRAIARGKFCIFNQGQRTSSYR